MAYVAKDEINGRACYVFECTDSMANSVITTIGQAFELRFRKFLNSMPTMKSTSTNKNPASPVKSHNLDENNMKLITNTQIVNHTPNFSAPSPNQTSNLNQEFMLNKVPPPTKKFNPNEIFSSQSQSQSNTPLSAIGHQQHQLHHTNTNPSKLSTNTNLHHTPNLKLGTQHKIDEKLEKMAWFHGLMTRENAEKLLVNNGDYLVRETNKAERQYVLSGRYKGECRHIFLVDPSGVVSF